MTLFIKDDTWGLYDTGSEYQPLSVFRQFVAKATPVEVPERFMHWLQIVEEDSETRVDVFYPKGSLKPGQQIEIIIHCPFCGVSQASWKHRDYGLFYYHVLPHLEKKCSEAGLECP